MKILIISFILIVAVLSGCASSDTIESAIQSSDVPLQEVLLTKEVENGAIAFIRLQNQEIAVSYLEKNIKGWKLQNISGAVGANSDKDISWRFYSGKIGSNAYPVFFGTIENSKIKKIMIQITSGDDNHATRYEATISKTPKNQFWFVYPTEELTGSNLKINVIGLDQNDIVIYQEL